MVYVSIEMVKYLFPRHVVILEIYQYTYTRKETFTRKYTQTHTHTHTEMETSGISGFGLETTRINEKPS